MDNNQTYNLQNYPGVLQIGEVERFRFCSRNDLNTTLIFAFDDADIDPRSASVAFNKQFFKSSLQAFRKKQDHGIIPVVIEAYFSNVVECNKLLVEHEIYMYNEDLTPVKAKVYAPVSINPPRYIAYAIYDLPLDAGFKTHKDIKNAIIDHIISRDGIEQVTKDKIERFIIVDTLLENDFGTQMPKFAFYNHNGRACVVLNGSTDVHLPDQDFSLFVSSSWHNVKRLSTHYMYCRNCRSFDLHETKRCPHC